MATCSLPSWVKEKEGGLSFEKVYERLAQEGQIPTKPPSKIGSENPLTYGFQGVTKETNCLLQQLQGRAQGTAGRTFGKLVRIDKNGDGVVDETEFSRYVKQKTGGDDPELYEDEIPPLARELWKFSILYTLATTELAITDVGPPSEPSPPNPPQPPMRIPETEIKADSNWFERNKMFFYGFGAVLVAGLFVFLFRRPIGQALRELGLLKKVPVGKPREVTVRTAYPPTPSQTPRPQTPIPPAGESRPTAKLHTADVEPVTPTAPRGAPVAAPPAAAPKKPPPTPPQAQRSWLTRKLDRSREKGRESAVRAIEGLERPVARTMQVKVTGEQLELLQLADVMLGNGSKGGQVTALADRTKTVVDRSIKADIFGIEEEITFSSWGAYHRESLLAWAKKLQEKGQYRRGDSLINKLAEAVNQLLTRGTLEFECEQALSFEAKKALGELPILMGRPRGRPSVTLPSGETELLRKVLSELQISFGKRAVTQGTVVIKGGLLPTKLGVIPEAGYEEIRASLLRHLDDPPSSHIRQQIWALIEKLFLSV